MTCVTFLPERRTLKGSEPAVPHSGFLFLMALAFVKLFHEIATNNWGIGV